MLGLIRRTFDYMDRELMKQLFANVVWPHLEYGSVEWHPFLKQDIELLEGFQHRAIGMVPGLAKLPYEERLRKMDLSSLAYRRSRWCCRSLQVFASLQRIVALVSWCSSVRLSGTGVHCHHTVHCRADLSLWLDSPMFWTP